MQIFEEFERRLKSDGMEFEKGSISPVANVPGVPIANRADEYEAGYRLYVVRYGDAANAGAASFSIAMAESTKVNGSKAACEGVAAQS
jgi:hypothetical protein